MRRILGWWTRLRRSLYDCAKVALAMQGWLAVWDDRIAEVLQVNVGTPWYQQDLGSRNVMYRI